MIYSFVVVYTDHDLTRHGFAVVEEGGFITDFGTGGRAGFYLFAGWFIGECYFYVGGCSKAKEGGHDLILFDSDRRPFF